MVSAVLRGMGDSKRPFIFISIAAVLNIILDLILVGGVGMGAGGAALATIISQGASFLFAVIYLYIKRESFGFDFKLKSFKIDWPILKAMSKLGIPIAFQTVAINVSMLFVNSLINSYGLVYSAVYGIGNKLNSIMFVITNSMNSAAAAMIGQNFGAGKFDRIKKIIRIVNVVAYVSFIVISAPCLIWPEQIFAVFTSDAAVISYAGQYMWVAVVMFLSFASMLAYLALMSGVGNGTLYLIVAIADGVVARIFFSIILAKVFDMGVWGYFWGSSIAGFVSTVWSMAYYYSGRWKKRKLLVEEE
jgi:putative MATE family efflux protein